MRICLLLPAAAFLYVCGIPSLGTAQVLVGSTTATGTSRAFNPAISVNALFLTHAVLSEEHGEHEADDHQHEEEHEHVHTHAPSDGSGAEVQEVEMQLSAVIDPYVTGNFTFAMHGTSGLELEEGYVTTSGLPANLQLRLGKLLNSFGKHNALHTHVFPFVSAPLIAPILLGGHGLNEIGAEASVLLPTPWFAELRASVTNGDNEVLFHGNEGSDLGYIGRWVNFLDLTEDSSLEVGVSGAAGPHADADEWSRVLGGDLTVKWKDPGPSYRTFVAQGEYLHGEAEGEVASGGYGLVKARFARRWWAQVGYDWASDLEGEGTCSRGRALVAYVPTEFTAWRLQYGATFDEHEDTEHELFLQLNVTLGSHPAHAY